MSAMSLVRASIRGVFLFAATTASLALAFAFAVGGPPTASEMAASKRVGQVAVRDVTDALEAWGHKACAGLQDVCGGVSPSRPRMANTGADAQHLPPPPAAPLVAADAPSPQQNTASQSTDAILLGGNEAHSASHASRVQPRAARIRSLMLPTPRPVSIAHPPETDRVVPLLANTQYAAAPTEGAIAALLAQVATLLGSPPPPAATPQKPRAASEQTHDEQAVDEAARVDDTQTQVDRDQQDASEDGSSFVDDDTDDRQDNRRNEYDDYGYRRHRWRYRY